MNYAPPLAACLAVLSLAQLAAAQSFNYPNFASVAGLTMNGSAVQSGTTVRVTNNGSADNGSVWYTTPVSVTEGFDTRFEFVLTPSPEGMAFVIHAAPTGAATLGGGIWGLGYGYGSTGTPITNSIAIEIDTIQNGFLNDTSANEVSIHTVGRFGNSENEGASIARITPAFDLSNNAPHTMRVRYLPGLLEVFINDLVNPLLTTVFSFENGGTQLSGGMTAGLGFTGNDGWVGFTGTTTSGSTGQNAAVRSWQWDSLYSPDDCYTGNVLAGTTGPHDVLMISNSTGGFFRTVRHAVADPFSFQLVPPPGESSAPFVLLLTLGIADATTVTTTPWGMACFPPVAPIDIGSFIAPYSVSVPPGIALNLSFTFQAVMATNSLVPSQIELTNAVALVFSLAPPPTVTNVLPKSAFPGGVITVTGDNFSLFATVDINGVPVTPLTLTKTQITFAMPAGVPCNATLTVRNPDGTSSGIAFNPTPTITNQVNTQGPSAGGTTYIIIGQGFAAGTTVTINGNPANVTSATATTVVCITPPGTPGPKPVVITTPGGCSVNSTFTYL